MKDKYDLPGRLYPVAVVPMAPMAEERAGSAGGPDSVAPIEEDIEEEAGSEGRGEAVEAAETPPALSHGFGGEAIYESDLNN